MAATDALPAWEVTTSASYRRVRAIASGGMGRVDLVLRREGTFARLYAVKRLHAHLRDDPELRAMFLEEARIAGLLRHPNVASVLDIGEDGEGPFLVMDYVDGVALDALARRANERGLAIPIGVGVRIVMQAAQGLAAAHELRATDGTPLDLVHRDVSPHNILVGFDGTTRVTDFGIAKALGRETHTTTGVLKGKLGYMSPEQLRFRQPDRRSDLFALGVVLYELLAGHRLYPGTRPEESARRILDEPPPDLAEEREDVPPQLVELLFRLLAKEPSQRPAHARDVARVLETVLAELHAEGDTGEVADFLETLFHDDRVTRTAEVAAAMEHTLIDAAPKMTLPPEATTASGRVGNVLQARGAPPEAENAAQSPSSRAGAPDHKKHRFSNLFMWLAGIALLVAGIAWWMTADTRVAHDAGRAPQRTTPATTLPAHEAPVRRDVPEPTARASVDGLPNAAPSSSPSPSHSTATEPSLPQPDRPTPSVVTKTRSPSTHRRRPERATGRDVRLWGWQGR